MSQAKKNSRIALCAVALLLATSHQGTAQDPQSITYGFEWTEVALLDGDGPSPRSGHRMVYDRARARVVLFGGRDEAGQLLNDLWEFDSASETWTEVAPASGDLPWPRASFGMAYDANRRKVVIYGGQVSTIYSNVGISGDTWEWDGETGVWTYKPAEPIVPVGLWGAELAYDPGRQQVILFGGEPSEVSPQNGRTYAWDGTNWMVVSETGPVGRVGHAMSTDPLHSVVTLFGGRSSEQGALADTWQWNGAEWTELASPAAGVTPPATSWTAMAFDDARAVQMLFGGLGSNETWEWDGAAWSRQTTGSAPSPRATSMVYDTSQSRFVLFGGTDGTANLGETWKGGPRLDQAPVIGDVEDVVAEATSADGATVDYTLPAVTDDTDPSPSVVGVPAPGAMFPIGETTVTITATDAAGNASSKSFKVSVIASTATRITAANPASSTYGQSVTLTAVVSSSGGGTPSGFVEFFDNDISLGTPAPLVDGTASFQTSAITVNNRLTATYRPTGLFGASTSPVFPYTVNKASTTSTLTPTPTARQYSDLVTFEATVSTVNGELPAESVTFKVGTQVVGTAELKLVGTVARGALSNVPLLEPRPWGTVPTGQMKPVPLGRAVTAVFNNVNPNFSVNSPAPKSLTITKEDARATYTGTLLASTPSPTATQTTVTLRATIKDISATSDGTTDTSAGDIRHATVTFINRDTGYAISPAINVTLPNSADTSVGEVSYDWWVTLTGNAQTFRVGIRVDNYYLRDNSSEDALVTVAKGLTSGFATGGGYLTMSTSGGLNPGTPGTLNTFGFGVSYKRNGSNPVGYFHTMIRSSGAVYYVKGATFTSVVVNGKTATLRGAASIYTVTTGSTLLDGAATFEVTMTDAGEPGTADQIGITVKNSAGVVWFSSNWTGAATLEQTLTAGNLKLPD